MQRIMETIFESGYLLFAALAGILILAKSRDKNEYTLFGIAALLLGVGDAFHLIPRMIALNTDGLENHVFSLGLGKLVTSITMTIFYVVLYYFFKSRYKKQTSALLDCTVIALAVIRIALCAFPQNEWFLSPSSYLWAIIRNIPFVILGLVFICLTFSWCKGDKFFRSAWLLVSLSFVFYLMTVLAAPFLSIMGMMMLPKTICYIILIALGLSAALSGRTETE